MGAGQGHAGHTQLAVASGTFPWRRASSWLLIVTTRFGSPVISMSAAIAPAFGRDTSST
jgi:hypothetical protein